LWCLLYGAAALTALLAADGAAGRTSAGAARTVTPASVTVTAGKPSEFRFKLSKSTVPAGTVIFKVTNAGKIPHSFKICTGTSAGTANSCAGKATAVLKTGKSATITVKLEKGRHEYLCTVAGHAAAGMKGILGVGVAAPVAIPKPTPVVPPTTTTTTAPPATGPVVGDPVAGATLFQSSGCGGCHTLKAAGTTGTAGPNLDEVAPDETTVITNVTYGNAMGMPAFSPQLSGAQIQNIAAYVYTSTHH
jgi:mono/diheme cytochrome c family protein